MVHILYPLLLLLLLLQQTYKGPVPSVVVYEQEQYDDVITRVSCNVTECYSNVPELYIFQQSRSTVSLHFCVVGTHNDVKSGRKIRSMQ